ncbi:acyl-CoA/acyl-ACP dehydrogenase [Frankia sp. AgPm24]|uniref:acyl-CoA dehydrogenase family protein n=1 Tax=Frankia sp. AgPm24 TaxID=631128 RepID=UPI00200DCA59|nr:acyl-CoA dehydrogenase family protein [Frankia sp. AgPm24]MCK9920934.1 acyl-CoA/acyl-ACP dehydrogenase [Frankia sp. AgPm24]
MFFALTDEQRALAETVRDVLADRFDLTAVRAVFEDAGGDGHPRELWRTIGDQGWLSVCVPVDQGGLGLGLVDAQVIARAFGAGVLPGPWASTVLAGEAVRRFGSSAQATAVLGPLGGGELVATVALRGPGGGLGRPGIAVRATSDGRLYGMASGVEYAAVADLLVVAALEAAPEPAPGADADAGGGTAVVPVDGVGLYLVDPCAVGVRVAPQSGFDGTTRLAAVTLEGVLGRRLPGSDEAALADLLRRGAVLAAADLVGLAREALRRTVAYDSARIQFGRPVGSFQALAHHLADLHVAVTMAEHAVLFAAHAVDSTPADISANTPADATELADPVDVDPVDVDRVDAVLAVAIAKSKASDTARDVTAAMIQYHGGIGYTWEHDTHFFYKRAKRLAAAYGDSGDHLAEIARAAVGPMS